MEGRVFLSMDGCGDEDAYAYAYVTPTRTYRESVCVHTHRLRT